MNTETYRMILVAMLPVMVALVATRAYYRRRQLALFARGHKVLTDNVGYLQVQLNEARARAERYQNKIAGVLQERDQWHKLWQEQSIGHGNAQNMMMGTIEEMGRLLTQHKVRYQLNPLLQTVRSEYLEQHEMPAREDLRQEQEAAGANRKAV